MLINFKATAFQSILLVKHIVTFNIIWWVIPKQHLAAGRISFIWHQATTSNAWKTIAWKCVRRKEKNVVKRGFVLKGREKEEEEAELEPVFEALAGRMKKIRFLSDIGGAVFSTVFFFWFLHSLDCNYIWWQRVHWIRVGCGPGC